MFFIGFLVFVMVVIAVALILLVLMQLPKKEAGVGVAFGGGATDALFGAGSGNLLTKITKWAAVAFFGLALVIAILQSHSGEKSQLQRQKQMIEEQASKLPTTQQAPAAAPTTAPTTAPAQTAPATAPATAPTTPAENPEKK